MGRVMVIHVQSVWRARTTGRWEQPCVNTEGNVRADAKLDNPKILIYSTKAKQ